MFAHTTKRKQKRSTQAQIRKMIDYMATNQDFAIGYSGSFGKWKAEEMWEQLRQILKIYGPDKDIDQWKHTWRDLRRKAKEDIASATTAATSNDIPEISMNSHRVLEIIKYPCSSVRPQESVSFTKHVTGGITIFWTADVLALASWQANKSNVRSPQHWL